MSRVLDLWTGMTGTVLPFAGSAAPTGWLLCYGQSVSRATYANLFAVLGTSFGAGDGSTTFNLPDLRGRVPAGKDDMGGSAASRMNVTTTGTTTNASTNITAIPSTAGLSIGMAVFGNNIPAGATITSITSATAITISASATGPGTGVSLRFGVVDGATLGAAGGSQVHKLVTSQMPAHTHTATLAATGPSQPAGEFGTDLLATASSTTTSSTGGDQSHPNMQPTIVLNSIIKF